MQRSRSSGLTLRFIDWINEFSYGSSFYPIYGRRSPTIIHLQVRLRLAARPTDKASQRRTRIGNTVDFSRLEPLKNEKTDKQTVRLSSTIAQRAFESA